MYVLLLINKNKKKYMYLGEQIDLNNFVCFFYLLKIDYIIIFFIKN